MNGTDLFERTFLIRVKLGRAESMVATCIISPFSAHACSPQAFGQAQVWFVVNAAEKYAGRSNLGS